MRLGIVTEAFGDRPLDAVLDWLADAAPAVTDLELGSGGYAPTTHCDRRLLLTDAAGRERWRADIEQRGFRIAALNAWGNPLHPDRELAGRHDMELRETILLAAELGVDRVLALAGCPGDVRPRFAAGGWLPYLEGDHERQWEEAGLPYWTELAGFGNSSRPGRRSGATGRNAGESPDLARSRRVFGCSIANDRRTPRTRSRSVKRISGRT